MFGPLATTVVSRLMVWNTRLSSWSWVSGPPVECWPGSNASARFTGSCADKSCSCCKSAGRVPRLAAKMLKLRDFTSSCRTAVSSSAGVW